MFMKRISEFYESCRTPIRVSYFGFAMIAIGFLIQNPNVNLFYTFRSTVVLFLAELLIRIGEFIIMNLPLAFMLNIVCKKANNASPVVMALVGYFTFVVTTMLFSSQGLDSLAYATSFGMNSVFNLSSGTRLPLETGMIGSILVALATRASFIYSRHRGSYSILNMFSKDTSGIIYNFLLCFALGILVSYGFPFLYRYIQRFIVYISENLSDPFRIGFYSILDRVLSILGLGNIIRYPFWYTSAGGSFSNALTGQSILGDVNIWAYLQDATSTYVGAGRFITPYYVINMFVIPGFYLGTLFCISDKNDRSYILITFIFAIGLSIMAGNPLPVELLMLFTSPALLLMYLAIVGVVSGCLVNFGAFLGFETTAANTVVAMPGCFPDFIVNIRNINMTHTLWLIFIIGLCAMTLMICCTYIYYRGIAFDFAHTGSGDKLVKDLIAAVGGLDNIDYVGSGLFKLNVYLKDLEKVSIEQVQEVGPRRVTETRSGLTFEYGTSSFEIARRISRKLNKRKRSEQQ